MSHRPFLVLWLGAFAFFLSFLLLLSALPIFARRLGASDGAIGVLMGAFAVTSLLLRPLTGWAADRYGRRPFMIAGSIVFTLASVAYGWAAGALALLLVRLAHGAGMGLYPTAASAMVADVTPPARRGEILGLYGAAGSIALAVGPLTGIALVGRLGFVGLSGSRARWPRSPGNGARAAADAGAPARRAVHPGRRHQRRRRVAVARDALPDVHLRHAGGVPAAAHRRGA